MDLAETLSAEQRLALAYAPSRARPAWLGLLALDQRLAEIVRQAREPMLGQIRLAWWRDLLSQDPSAWPEGEPLVCHIADHLAGVAPRLAELATGWEYLLSGEVLTPAQFSGYAAARAGAYAVVAEQLAGERGGRVAQTAATWWVLGDTYSRLSNEAERANLIELADTTPRPRHHLGRTGRPLAVLGALGERAVRRREPVLEGRASALLALRVGMFGR